MPTRPDSPLHRVWKQAQRRFRPGNSTGVVGYAIGPRRVGPEHRTQRTLVVFVRTKDAAPPRPIRPIAVTGKARAVMPDVRATGALPTAHAGGRPRAQGLGCGAPILIAGRGSSEEIGGVACLLGNPTGPTHLVTAGHLFAPRQLGTRVLAGMPGGRWLLAGRVVANLLDEPDGLDCALVELTASGRGLAFQTRSLLDGGGLKLPVTTGARRTTRDETVFGFPSTRGEWTAPSRIEPFDQTVFHLISRRRGTFTIRNCIRTIHALTMPGDSGSGLLVHNDERTLLVGLCSGGDASGSCFTDARGAVSRLLAISAPNTFIWG